MKKILILIIVLLFIITSCSSSKYKDEAISLANQDIDISITEAAHENIDERLKTEGNDELLVITKGSP